MKRIYLLILVMAASMTIVWADDAPTSPERVSSACEWLRKMTGLPEHYCICLEDSKTFSFPLDIKNLKSAVWYSAKLKDVKKGITAYLYADDEVKIDIYLNCMFSSPSYSYTLSPNQTRDINSEKIEEKLASAGVTIDDNTAVNFKIYPVSGTVERVICMPYNQGFHSTCSDCLEIFPKMTVVSSNADDVFYLDPAYVTEGKGLKVYWKESNNTPCHLTISLGTCNGDIVADADILSSSQPYYMDETLLNSARAMGKKLYLHFTHDAKAVGRIVLKEYEKATTAIMDVTSEAEAKIIMDRNGMMYIRRGNERYTILGNKL